MFTLTELEQFRIHGEIVAVDYDHLVFPINIVGPLLEWRLRRMFVDDLMVFDKPSIKLFPGCGDLHVPVAHPILPATKFSWHAEPHILHAWTVKP